jgi:hypothetical protein
MDYSIAEKFLLIAHHPQKARFIASEVHISYGLIGSLLLDLYVEKSITLDGKRVVLTTHKSGKNEVYDDMISKMRSSSNPKKIQTWISIFSRRARKYKWAILTKFEERGVLKIEHKKFLFIPYRRTYLLNIQLRETILADLLQKVIAFKPLSEEDSSILSLLDACKLHKTLSTDKTEIKKIKAKLKTLLKESPIASATDATIKQVQAAIIASIAATTAASAATR